MRRLRRAFRSPRYHFVLLVVLLIHSIEVLQASRQQAPRSPVVSRANQRVFIASLHWNNEHVLRSYWNNAVLDLARSLGPENIFISIHESGSWDNSKGALSELDRKLGTINVPRNVTLSNISHKDEIRGPPQGPGWIDTPRGMKERRRIPYLAHLRNIALDQFRDLVNAGQAFDKILFLNDVVFTVSRPWDPVT